MSRIFHNPVVPGFAADPSVVLVDDIFYLATSSFHVFPGIPIYASANLQDWTLIGNAINRLGQIRLHDVDTKAFPVPNGKNLVATTGLFAPTIRHHKGVFYILCTNARSEGMHLHTENFLISTTDIWANKWSDPIFFEFQGIDPSLFFDHDDRAYVQGSWHAGPLYDAQASIRQFEIDIESGKRLSDVKEIWKGFLGKGDAEGPHIYKKDGYYYLIVAEGGTWEHHLIAVARSDSIWGPFESYELNPIMTADSTDEYIQHTGHGELIQDVHGQWWVLVLGVRYGDQGLSPLGRETFLSSVEWPEGEWPTIDHPRSEFERRTDLAQYNADFEQRVRKVEQKTNHYLYIRDPELSNYIITNDEITLAASETNMDVRTGTSTFIGRRQRSQTCTTTVRLRLTSNNQHVQAGISVFKECLRHVDMFYDFNDKSIFLKHTNDMPGKIPRAVLAVQQVSEVCTAIEFKIKASPNSYEFYFRTSQDDGNGTDWCSLGKLDGIELAGVDFTGPIFGLFATRSSSSEVASGEKAWIVFADFT